MRFRTLLVYLSLLPLGACTRSCKDFDNAEEFSRAALPPYTETGAATLGCRLGPQVWTVLGSHYINRIGYPWEVNGLLVEGGSSVPPYVAATGEMTGVRNSKPFYDMQISLVLRLTDTLANLRQLGTPAPMSGPTTDYMQARNMMSLDEDYQTRSRRPVRLLIRKLDRKQRIVSGTFEGYLYGRAGGKDSISVTDGRFDVRY